MITSIATAPRFSADPVAQSLAHFVAAAPGAVRRRDVVAGPSAALDLARLYPQLFVPTAARPTLVTRAALAATAVQAAIVASLVRLHH